MVAAASVTPNPVLFVLSLVVTLTVGVAIFAAVARRVLGVPLGLIRTTLAGALAIAVDFAVGPSVGQRGLGSAAASIPVGVGISLVVALTFLVVAEILVPSGSWPSVLQWPRLLRRRARRSRRYWQVVVIGLRHGLGPYLRRGLRDSPDRRDRMAASLRQALDEGGVTFVKLGQVASTRADLLPPEVIRELGRLQDHALPAPWEQVHQVLGEELGALPTELFAGFQLEPLASASVAQVHRAQLQDGTEVVVKVQRPGIGPAVELDLDIVSQMARKAEIRSRWGRALGVVELASGFAGALREELDFRVEAANMAAVASALQASAPAARDDGPVVRIPALHQDLCTRRVLVMEWLDGVPLAEAGPVIAERGLDRLSLARTLFGTVLRQVIVGGVFHADPHPGNVLLLADASLGLLDFGSVGRLNAALQAALGQLLFALDRGDPAGARDAFLELVVRPDDLDEQRLERSLGQFMARWLGAGSSPSLKMFADLFRLVTVHQLAILPEVAGVFRALATLEGTLGTLAPGFDIVAEARVVARTEVGTQLGSRPLSEMLTDELYTTLPVLRRLPRRVDRIGAALEQNRLGVNVRLFADERDRRFATDLVNQVLLTFLAAACGVIATLLLGTRGGPTVTPHVSLFQVFGYNLLLIACVLALRVLFTIFRRRSP